MSNPKDNDKETSEDENYIIKAKVCKRLSRELGLEDLFMDEIINYNPPCQYGLSNAEVIIPSYYKLHEHPYKLFTLDFYEIIKDDIRNCRVLKKEQLDYIENLGDEYKMELINIFNDCIKMFSEYLLNNETHK